MPCFSCDVDWGWQSSCYTLIGDKRHLSGRRSDQTIGISKGYGQLLAMVLAGAQYTYWATAT